jgi:putative acetyltransferase
MIEFVQASTAAQIEDARKLFREYEAWLGIDLCFQSFEKELAELPGKYAPPTGCLLLAVENEQVLGCIALRQIDNEICEMKRLFVRSEAQGRGLGKDLIKELIKRAQAIGYRRMRLDTIASKMEKAVAIYRSFGFREMPAYYNSPITDTVFMELDLEKIR